MLLIIQLQVMSKRLITQIQGNIQHLFIKWSVPVDRLRLFKFSSLKKKAAQNRRRICFPLTLIDYFAPYFELLGYGLLLTKTE